MDVINLSLGRARDRADARHRRARRSTRRPRAGVVPVVAAGNDFDEFGRGSVSSPGSTPEAITVGAVSTTRSGAPGVVASFSSGGPTPLSLQLKPEVSAPGVVDRLGEPRRDVRRALGHEHGGAARRRRRRAAAAAPSGVDAGAGQVRAREHRRPCVPRRRPHDRGADDPRGRRRRQPPPRRPAAPLREPRRALVRPRCRDRDRDADALADRRRRRRGRLGRHGRAADRRDRRDRLRAPDRDRSRHAAGDGDDRRHAERRALGLRRAHARRRAPARPVLVSRLGAGARRARRRRRFAKAGAAQGDDPGRHDPRLDATATPRAPRGSASRPTCPAPSACSASTSRGRSANFGVVVTVPREGRRRGAAHRPRRRREPAHRLSGAAVQPQPVSADVPASPCPPRGRFCPARGAYDVVFDSPSGERAGAFTFRFWIGDTKPPVLTLRTRTVRRGTPLVVRATDAGSGVDPARSSRGSTAPSARRASGTAASS